MENRKNITSTSKCLPLEIESNILSRVPIKDLLRYQCVCKRWRDEIKNPNFIKSHTSQIIKFNNTNSRASVILFCRWSAKLYSLDYHSPKNVKKLTRFSHPLVYDAQLVGSCNGLLCFIKRFSRCFSIYNPATNASKIVPVSPLRPYNVLDVNAKYRIGFGYDCTSNDYKILQAETVDMKPKQVESHIYSLKNNSWNVVQPLRIYLSTYSNRMLFSNNALHWIDLKPKNSSITNIMSRIITCFDLGTEEYHELSFPNDDNDGVFKYELADIRGCLHLVKYSTIHGMEIWIMKEYGVKQAWSKLVSTELDNNFADVVRRQVLFGQPLIPLPLAYSEDGQEILVGLGQPGMNFVQYDMRSGGFKRLEIQACDLATDLSDAYVVMPWVGSFVSPHLYCNSAELLN